MENYKLKNERNIYLRNKIKQIVLVFSLTVFFMETSHANNHSLNYLRQDVNSSSDVILNAELDKYKSDTKDFRVLKIRKGIESHNKHKPKNWDKYLKQINEKTSNIEKLRLVNKIVNKIPYIDDTNGDYFSPGQMEKRGGGVCKDFAEYKYILLKEAGFNPNDMFFLAMQPREENGPWHVTLAVRENNQVYILEMNGAVIRQQRYAELHTNINKEKKKIIEVGIELTEKEMSETDFVDVDGFQTIQKYKWGTRKLDWIGNENDSISNILEFKKKIYKK